MDTGFLREETERMERVLVFQGVTGKKRRFHLQDINLELQAGYIYGLIGENGAGKTTLMKYILDENTAYDGNIWLEGEDVKDNHAVLRNKIGFVSEENIFLGDMSGEQNARLLGSLYDAFDMGIFMEAMKFMKVSATKTYSRMSRGEQLKFQMAFAMAHRPCLYLLDEVTAGMDSVFCREFFGMLRELIREECCSVLMSSHKLPEIEKMTDYAAVMEQGTIVCFGESIDIERSWGRRPFGQKHALQGGDGIEVGQERKRQGGDGIEGGQERKRQGGDGIEVRQEGKRQGGGSAEAGENEKRPGEKRSEDKMARKQQRERLRCFFKEELTWFPEHVANYLLAAIFLFIFVVTMAVPVQEREWNEQYQVLRYGMALLGMACYVQNFIRYTEQEKIKSMYQLLCYLPISRKALYHFIMIKVAGLSLGMTGIIVVFQGIFTVASGYAFAVWNILLPFTEAFVVPVGCMALLLRFGGRMK